MTVRFHDLTLTEAERQIVGAVIDHRDCCQIAAETLRLGDVFRSEQADELRAVFYTVLGWYGRSRWSEGNRQRLERRFDAGFIDSLWCPWATSEDYFRQLCQTVRHDNELADAAIKSRLHWQERGRLRRGDVPQEAKTKARGGGVEV